MTTIKDIGPRIDNVLELSSVCRGEWCRYLESEMDVLDSELHEYVTSGDVHEPFCLHKVTENVQQGYKNLSPVFRCDL